MDNTSYAKFPIQELIDIYKNPKVKGKNIDDQTLMDELKGLRDRYRLAIHLLFSSCGNLNGFMRTHMSHSQPMTAHSTNYPGPHPAGASFISDEYLQHFYSYFMIYNNIEWDDKKRRNPHEWKVKHSERILSIDPDTKPQYLDYRHTNSIQQLDMGVKLTLMEIAEVLDSTYFIQQGYYYKLVNDNITRQTSFTSADTIKLKSLRLTNSSTLHKRVENDQEKKKEQEKRDKKDKRSINEVYRNYDKTEKKERKRTTEKEKLSNPIPPKVWKAFNAIIHDYGAIRDEDDFFCQYDQCTSSKSKKNHLSHLCYSYWAADPTAAEAAFWKATEKYATHNDKAQYIDDMNTMLEGPSFDRTLRAIRSAEITHSISNDGSDDSSDDDNDAVSITSNTSN